MALFKDRLNDALSMRDMTPAELSRLTSINEGAISQYRKGAYKATQHNLEKLSIVLNVSIPWLMGADVPMVKQEDNTFDIFSLPNIMPLPKMKKVPRLGKIACGQPIMTEENFDGYDNVPDSIQCDFSLTCNGDSMINARINSGDIVYIRQQSIVDNGEIAAVMVNGETTLKRIYLYKNKVVLQAENPKYEPWVYVNEELDNIQILGKAVGFTSVIR